MPQQYLSVARAVRLVGVSRGTLQRKIRAAGVETFEGKIALSDLLRLYPDAQTDEATSIEKVQNIKAKARPGRAGQTEELPEVISRRLTSLSRELVESREQLRHLRRCADQLVGRLQALKGADPEAVGAIVDWVETEMRDSPESSDARVRLLAKDAFLRIISAHVKMIPSGHDFFVEGNDSLLNASLRAGLHVNYGCSSGNCGACKARVVSGEVYQLRDYEYELSDSERNLGYILMCSYTAATDVTLEAGEASSVDDLPLQTIPARVERIQALNDQFRLLQLRTPADQTLRFLAGQAVSLTLGQDRTLAYLASCPCDGEVLQFHVRHDDTALASRVFDGLEKGAEITVEGPTGHFVLQEEPSAPVLMLCWEEGFAPVKSMMEHAVAMDAFESLRIEWFAASEAGHYQENLCRAWSDALDSFDYRLTLTEEIAAGQAVRRCIGKRPELADSRIYISGPDFFVDAAKGVVDQLGVPKDRVHRGVIGAALLARRGPD